MAADDVLSNFRHEWRREIENYSGQRVNPANEEAQDVSLSTGDTTPVHASGTAAGVYQSDKEREAADLFTKGVQLEQNGKLYESITYYKRAIMLVPDIELKVHRQTGGRDEDIANSNSPSIITSENEDSDDDDEETTNMKDLISKFENLLCGNQPLCRPNYSQEKSHISCLPPEMFEKVFSWLVGKELDLESLDNLGRVCRGFYLLSRNPDLWKRACVCLWGIETDNMGLYKSWREMFIWRPRPRFNGCYIARTTYFRSGENSFQDLSYQPWHIVCYYRYLRFFSNGCVLMLTSSEEPQSVVGHLKKLESKHSQVLSGRFRLHGSCMTLLFRRSSPKKKHRFLSRDEGNTNVQETTLQMELEVKAVRHRPNWQLLWKCYSIVSSYTTGNHATSVVDVSDTNNFPPLSFSKVRSYSAQTTQALP